MSDGQQEAAAGERLQRHVEGLHRLYGRDIVIVDAQKRGLADADATEIGQVFDDDPGNEVGRTIKDGEIRPIVGAVILEYTQIYQELLDAAVWQI